MNGYKWMAALEYHSWPRKRIPSNQLAQLKDSVSRASFTHPHRVILGQGPGSSKLSTFTSKQNLYGFQSVLHLEGQNVIWNGIELVSFENQKPLSHFKLGSKMVKIIFFPFVKMKR